MITLRGSLSKLVPLIVVLFLTFASSSLADEPANDNTEEANKRTTKAAKTYEFRFKDDQAKLQLNPKSVLRWSNPVAGELYGNVFVWTDKGRPEVIGSLLQWYSPNTHASHEMHSLSEKTIEGFRSGTKVWETQSKIQWIEFPSNIAVATTPRARKTQMRALSRRFTVEKEDREALTRNLRILNQPLMEYGDEKSTVIAGGLFVFVQGTDPEVFVLIEARKTTTKLKWHYAFARMNSVKFDARYDDETVWRVDIWPWSKAQNGRELYFHSGRIDP